MKRNVFCYGDSLTWGYNAEDGSRFSPDQRWTGLLQELLGGDYKIIEQGFNGRTTVFDSNFRPNVNGEKTLSFLLESNVPLDLVVLFLGGNDVQPMIGKTAMEAALGCGTLIRIIKNTNFGRDGKIPEILLISPHLINESKNLMNLCFEGSEKEFDKFSKNYETVAKYFKIHFLDLKNLVKASKLDGVHYDIEGNKTVADLIYKKIQSIFGK